MGGEERPVLGGPMLCPVGEAVLVDEMGGVRLLAAVGDKKGSEFGHSPALAEASGGQQRTSGPPG